MSALEVDDCSGICRLCSSLVIPSNKSSENKGKFNSGLVCLGCLKDYVIYLDGTFNDTSSQSKISGAFFYSLSEHFGTGHIWADCELHNQV